MEQKTLLSELAADTLRGLSSTPKFLLSKYFYDDQGSRIFQDIMQMPEYYLTDCEHEIFTTHREQIAEAFGDGGGEFNLIELGSGDGLKTKILLQQMVRGPVSFQYMPIDISRQANEELVKSLKDELPDLRVQAKTGDYFQQMNHLNGYAKLRKVMLFLGSNIGNFSDEQTDRFLTRLSEFSHPGDKLLIGFDLKKSPTVIMKAYNDPHGHTRRFNLNHLERLNRELGADFNLSNFEQHTSYDPVSGAVKSFLVSGAAQSVSIDALGQIFHFNQWEPIFMEQSRKFDNGMIENLASEHEFKVVRNFTDKQNYFVDSLWEKVEG